ncbi:acyltransferase [Alicyclobacillus sp. SO9]|uniref:acyltransferase n=1 Tax=Alicyclobacillus sp. SO9 TaxID=2665646 RepID=UPI0018E78E78|nr:acyltransferase [Alicyclobacillus sp. SO9]QQE76878.1 acyltransferase [Alicyclobacillus sp. SO9]
MEKKKHLYEIDLMRGFIMLCVLSVHTIARYIEMEPASMEKSLFTMGAVISSLHFTRESFMFITGLVLFVTYYHSDFRPLRFWRKRFSLIVVPYLVWNIVYILFEGAYRTHFDWSVGALLHEWTHALMFGNQFYLYYVLVTIQFYVVFPFLLYALRRLKRWHSHIFIGSFVLQLFLMYLTKFVLPHINLSNLPVPVSYMTIDRTTFILTYQFWFMAGGIVACHYRTIVEFFEQRSRLVWMTFGIGIALFYAHFVLDWVVFKEGGLAESVLQPVMVPYSLLITLVIWFTGLRWAARRTRISWRPFSKFVQTASDTSFGIFLIQPFPLWLMETTVKHMKVPPWIHFSLIPVSVLFVYFSSMFAAFWIGKVPILGYSVGRKVNLRKRIEQSVSATAS